MTNARNTPTIDRRISARVISVPSLARSRSGLADRSEIANHVVELRLGQPIGAVIGHQRTRLLNHLAQIASIDGEKPLARVHDLDRERILGLANAARSAAVAR